MKSEDFVVAVVCGWTCFIVVVVVIISNKVTLNGQQGKARQGRLLRNLFG